MNGVWLYRFLLILGGNKFSSVSNSPYMLGGFCSPPHFGAECLDMGMFIVVHVDCLFAGHGCIFLSLTNVRSPGNWIWFIEV